MAEEYQVVESTRPELGPGETLIEYPELGVQLICSLNTDKETMLENVRTNIRHQGLGKVWPCKPMDREDAIAIVTGGPSLLDTLDELRAAIADGARCVSLANATHVLLENGIRPSAQVLLDAKPRNAEFAHDVPGCTYFLASQCDPSVFERVMSFSQMNGYSGFEAKEGQQRIILWHAVNSDEELQAVMDLGEPWVPVQAGSTITLRALRLFQILGYWRFHVFGMDSCMMGGRHHAYEQPAADHLRVADIGCNGRRFDVTGWQIHQVMEFMKFCRLFAQELEMSVHGDGLIAHMIRTSATQSEAA